MSSSKFMKDKLEGTVENWRTWSVLPKLCADWEGKKEKMMETKTLKATSF